MRSAGPPPCGSLLVPGFPSFRGLKLCPLLAGERKAVAVLVGAVEARRLGDAEEAVPLPGLPVLEDRCGLDVRGVSRAARLRRAEPLHLHAGPVELALTVRLGLEPAEDVADEHVLALGAANVLRRRLECGPREGDLARLDRQDRLRLDRLGVGRRVRADDRGGFVFSAAGGETENETQEESQPTHARAA